MTKNKISILISTLVAIAAVTGVSPVHALTLLQQPSSTKAIPGNLLLALSVEFPTGVQISYTATTYTVTQSYKGYFDNAKCYSYDTTNEVFKPVSAMNTNGSCPVASQWSGNLLNWLTMTNLDQFRSVMTGGTRDSFSSMNATYPGDTTERTVLIRSFTDRNSNNPTKNLTVGTPGMPLTGVNKFVRSAAYGSKFIVSNANNFADLTDAQRKATCANTPLPGAAGTSACYNIRVEACVAVTGAPIESNCVSGYTNGSGVASVPKPEGLIQKYSANLRFGALGYLNVANQSRNGAVLRSAMKSVGANQINANGSLSTNPNKEWSEITGIMVNNPDADDATASGVANSGLMNYLNKFGFASGYETYDNVGELYYAALLYLRGKAPPAEYSNNLTTVMKDDFPVITGANLLAGGSRDPMIMSCQKNFILGIGDKNTWCDGNLPGSTASLCSAGTPVDPDGLNVSTLWNTVYGLEGLTGRGWVGGVNDQATPYMAGLAHWANTNDTRLDLEGKQSISTYWVDVLEPSYPTTPSLTKTQYWLAAKYGGFRTNLVSGNDPNSVRASWDSNNDGVPDTWFAGNEPDAMRSGLTTAFADIASRAQAGSAGSPAISSPRQTTSTQVIYSSYDPDGWTGALRGCSPDQASDLCNSNPIWEASRWFKTTTPTYVTTPLTPATRKIFTSSTDSGFSKMPFLWSSLNSSQKAVLDAGGLGSARVSYLRGDRSNESNGTFRPRKDSLLGDIVNSGVTYVGGPGRALSGSLYAGHSTYRATNATRPPVVYVGANDGMLHAFSATNGKELFGYIPSAVFSNLPGLTLPEFQHHYFVDSTPMSGDIFSTDSTWKTILVGGLGAGGRGYYALDISTQSTFETATEATLANLPMWEFTSTADSDLGYTFNEPVIDPITAANSQISKTVTNSGSQGQWSVVVGNGFGSDNGKAVLYFLNASTGSVQSKLVAHGGPNNGLATPNPVDTDYDGLVDTVYAGDLLGNLHKFQFSKASGANYVLASKGDPDGAWRYIGILYATGEPITMAPAVVKACDGVGQLVTIGTGKLIEADDYTDTSTRSFIAVEDDKPSSSLTVSSTQLANISYTTTVQNGETVRTWSAPNLSGKAGWKMLFTAGERVLSNPGLPADTGAVLIGTTQPGGSACVPSSSGFVNSVNLCSGKIGGLLVNGTLVGGISLGSSAIVKVGNSYVSPTNESVVLTNQSKTRGGVLKNTTNATPKGRYSWREILTK